MAANRFAAFPEWERKGDSQTFWGKRSENLLRLTTISPRGVQPGGAVPARIGKTGDGGSLSAAAK